MRTNERDGRSRRAVLRAGAAAVVTAAAGLAVTGCDLLSDDPEPPAAPDPLAPLLAGTTELISRYDAALTAHPGLGPRLEPIRAAHQAHLTELAALIGTPAPGTPGPGASDAGAASPGGTSADQRGTLAALRAAEQSGQRAASAACLTAPADRATLLGYLAAARASHAEVLR